MQVVLRTRGGVGKKGCVNALPTSRSRFAEAPITRREKAQHQTGQTHGRGENEKEKSGAALGEGCGRRGRTSSGSRRGPRACAPLSLARLQWRSKGPTRETRARAHPLTLPMPKSAVCTPFAARALQAWLEAGCCFRFCFPGRDSPRAERPWRANPPKTPPHCRAREIYTFPSARGFRFPPPWGVGASPKCTRARKGMGEKSLQSPPPVCREEFANAPCLEGGRRERTMLLLKDPFQGVALQPTSRFPAGGGGSKRGEGWLQHVRLQIRHALPGGARKIQKKNPFLSRLVPIVCF